MLKWWIFKYFCVLYIALFLFLFSRACLCLWLPTCVMAFCYLTVGKKIRKCRFENGTPRSKYTGFSFYCVHLSCILLFLWVHFQNRFSIGYFYSCCVRSHRPCLPWSGDFCYCKFVIGAEFSTKQEADLIRQDESRNDIFNTSGKPSWCPFSVVHSFH